MTLPSTEFGSTGQTVSRVGLGGEGVLRTFGRDEEAYEVVNAALEAGITYFDTAPAYSGSEKYLGAVWRDRPEDLARIFHTSKSAERSKDGALADLARTFATLGADSIDLWQIHDVRTEDDIRAIEGPGGALEAFLSARENGKVGAIGVTGHHDPAILTRCVREWPVDAVLLPVNPLEGAIGGFLTETLPAARERGLGVIGMKVLGGGHYVQGGIDPRVLMAYALTQDIDVAIVGCSTPQEVRTLAETCEMAATTPMSSDERAALEDAFRPHARQLAYYRGRV
jgi:aryl-alcohol dehydrogenase-like predicted oxidoreductase